jgi:hypothetical protein
METLRHAFKEWAAICRALAEGRQAVILRKGGIVEPGGAFRMDHDRFWLFPTYAHQKREALTPEAAALLDLSLQDRPPEGTLRLTHFAEVAGAHHLDDLGPALRLEGMHGWSEDTVRARFAYRKPGLFVFAVRVYRSAQTFEVPDRAEYAGCRSWVELDEALPAEGEPVLGEEAFRDVLRELGRRTEFIPFRGGRTE